MLTEVKPDMVVVATPWEDHAAMAWPPCRRRARVHRDGHRGHDGRDVAAGEHLRGDRPPLHAQENVCYGREELLYLNMVRQGLIGEVLHGEAAYIHDLRDQMKQVGARHRVVAHVSLHQTQRQPVPVPRPRPVAQYMNLARTEDTFGQVVSFSSPSRVRALYAKANFPPDHKWNKEKFVAGDISTAIIKTASDGRSWSSGTSSPRARIRATT